MASEEVSGFWIRSGAAFGSYGTSVYPDATLSLSKNPRLPRPPLHSIVHMPMYQVVNWKHFPAIRLGDV